VRVSHTSLRIIVHEHVRVLMTRGYVDSLLVSSGGGVSLAVWNRDTVDACDVNSVNTNDCRDLDVSCCRYWPMFATTTQCGAR